MKKLPSDIEALEKRIAEFENKNVEHKKNVPLTNSRLFAKAFVLGTEFIGAVVIGIGLGVMLDWLCGIKIVFTIIFTLFGCAAGVMNMYKSAKEMEKELDR